MRTTKQKCNCLGWGCIKDVEYPKYHRTTIDWGHLIAFVVVLALLGLFWWWVFSLILP
jgi:cytoskeletal protein RodZ